MDKIKIFIADDHPLFRSGVMDVVSKLENTIIIGEAENGMIAYQEIIATLPDIAILDIEMPILSGIDVAQKVLNEKQKTDIILLTMHKSKVFFLAAMNYGVKGYLLKDNAIEELLQCISEVRKGNTFVSQQFKTYLNDTNEYQTKEMEMVQTLLTPTEKVILKLISESKTSAEIADLLFISPNTVDNHRSNIAKKLKLEGKNSLLKFAIGIKQML